MGDMRRPSDKWASAIKDVVNLHRDVGSKEKAGQVRPIEKYSGLNVVVLDQVKIGRKVIEK